MNGSTVATTSAPAGEKLLDKGGTETGEKEAGKGVARRFGQGSTHLYRHENSPLCIDRIDG